MFWVMASSGSPVDSAISQYLKARIAPAFLQYVFVPEGGGYIFSRHPHRPGLSQFLSHPITYHLPRLFVAVRVLFIFEPDCNRFNCWIVIPRDVLKLQLGRFHARVVRDRGTRRSVMRRALPMPLHCAAHPTIGRKTQIWSQERQVEIGGVSQRKRMPSSNSGCDSHGCAPKI